MLPSSCLAEACQCVYRSWNNWICSSWVGKLCFISIEVVDGVLLLTAIVNIPVTCNQWSSSFINPKCAFCQAFVVGSLSVLIMLFLSLLVPVVQVEHSRASLSFSEEIQPSSCLFSHSLFLFFFNSYQRLPFALFQSLPFSHPDVSPE